MNEQHQDLLKQLEIATSSDAQIPVGADDDTANMREGWQAFTQLLEAADAEQNQELPIDQLVSPSPRRTWRVVAASTVAASLLIALATLWSIGQRPVPAPDDTHSVAMPQEGPAEQTVDKSSTAQSSSQSDDQFAWDDTLDERLADAHLALFSVRYAWRRDESDFRVLSDQIQQIEQELETGSL